MSRPAFYHFPAADPIWRRLLMGAAIQVLYPLAEKIFIDRPEITWADHVRWFIEGVADHLFSLGYEGSDAELCSALNGEIPLKYMSERQFAAVLGIYGFPIPLDDFGNVDTTVREEEAE